MTRRSGGDGATHRGGDVARLDAAALQGFFADLVHDAVDLHTIVDLEARFVYVNAAARTVLGLEPGACRGRSAFDFVHPDDRATTRREFKRWCEEPRALQFENRQVGTTGVERRLLWTVTPRHADDGTLAGFASIGRDVTQVRATERSLLESEAMHRALLDGMLDAVIVIDGRGTIRMVSRATEEVFGYAPRELIGRNVSVLMTEPHRSEHDGYLARYRETGETSILGRTRAFQARHRDGSLLEIELSVARVDPPGKPDPVFIGSVRDVTERARARRAERSLLRALATIGESSAMLMHEIKSPITAINLALRAVADRLGADEHEVLTDLVSRLRRLELQMRQALTFAKPLEPRFVSCEAGAVFASVGRSLAPVLERAGVRLGLDVAPDAPAFAADPERLEETLANLVVNAVEMMPDGGRVVLRARSWPGRRVRLEVEDDGPGVPASVRATLFQPFETSKPEGTGLGLAICRRIVEELGGTITLVDGGALGGARFGIELPLTHEEGP